MSDLGDKSHFDGAGHIFAMVYLVHLKVKHCQTLRVVSTFTGKHELTVFDL